MQNIQAIQESHFYSHIRSSVDSGRKSDFALYLSMLSKNALDFDQFNLPSSLHKFESAGLEKQFGIVKIPIVGIGNPQKSIEQNNSIHDDRFSDVKLSQAINPESVFCKINNSAHQIPDVLYDNLDISTQARLNRDVELDKRVETKESNVHGIGRPNSMDIDAWFKVLNQSRNLDLVS